MRSTIRQVAERAGVSRTTVSNVLLGRHDIVAEDKCMMVMQAARELDYVPVRPTLQNRHVETRVIAVPFSDPKRIKWGINSGTYSGLCEQAMAHSYDVLMLLRADPDWAVDRAERQFLDRRSDGIIFAAPNIGESERTFEALARHNIPAVVCYRRDLPKDIIWVDVDNQAAIYGAVEHLVQMGHKRILHVTENDEMSFDNLERRRYFTMAMCDFGMQDWAEKLMAINYHQADAKFVQQLLDTGATAVIAMNDLLALNLKKVMVEMGLNVPGDLSLIGIDGNDAAANDLTSMEFSFADIGRRATDALVKRLQGSPTEDCCYQVPVQLATRGSVKDMTVN